MKNRLLFGVLALTIVTSVGWSRLPAWAAPPHVTAPVPAQPASTSTSTSTKGRTFELGQVIGNLTIYPVLMTQQSDPGAIVSLEVAMGAHTAEIRELTEASVNSLAIENKGDAPVFVLAGTILKGGKQDRQVGQDFIIEPHKTATIDAFCVEHGRWNGNRNGKLTQGKFASSQTIALSKVRVAGQYKKNQSEVWSKVAETNSAHRQSSASGTLSASLDNADLVAKRFAIASQIDSALRKHQPESEIVGYAYAIGGEIRGARWFEHRKLFEMHRPSLLQGIALELLTEEQEAQNRGMPLKNTKSPTTAEVEAFVAGVDAQGVAEARDTAGSNVNQYKESRAAYGSSTMMKPMGKGGTARKLSSDYAKK
jgi:hypothetical protein